MLLGPGSRSIARARRCKGACAPGAAEAGRRAGRTRKLLLRRRILLREQRAQLPATFEIQKGGEILLTTICGAASKVSSVAQRSSLRFDSLVLRGSTPARALPRESTKKNGERPPPVMSESAPVPFCSVYSLRLLLLMCLPSPAQIRKGSKEFSPVLAHHNLVFARKKKLPA